MMSPSSSLSWICSLRGKKKEKHFKNFLAIQDRQKEILIQLWNSFLADMQLAVSIRGIGRLLEESSVSDH